MAADELERVPARIAAGSDGRSRTQVRRYVTALALPGAEERGTLTWQPGEVNPDRMQRLLVRRLGLDGVR